MSTQTDRPKPIPLASGFPVVARLAASVQDGAGDSVAHAARRYVLSHYTESDACSTALLAERLGVTASHLCHVYKSTWGVTIGCDLRRLRIELAKRLLADRSLPIKQVAARVGYEKATYRAFFNAFRGEAGMPPSKYRRRLRQVLRGHEPTAAPVRWRDENLRATA